MPQRRPALPASRLRHHPGSGLTLLELVITLAVLAVLGTLAMPNVGSQLERQRLRDVAQTLAGDIAEARYLAAQRGQALYVLAQPGAQWCWAISTSTDCDCQTASACATHITRAADHPGATLSGAVAIHLDATGVPAEPTSTTLEAPHGETLRVDVTALGRSRICAAVGKWPNLPACP